MYEHMKNELLNKLDGVLSPADLSSVCQALDAVAVKYQITQMETLPAVIIDKNYELLRTYLICRKIEGLNDKTTYNYNKILSYFLADISKPLEDVTANDIRVFLMRYKQARGISDRSLDKTRQFIRTFFSWLTLEGYIPKDVSLQVKPIKHIVPQRHALTQIQMEHIRRACVDPRERMVIEMLYSTGCRISELCGMKISDIDMHEGSVQVLGKGNKYRTCYINAKALVALSEYLKTMPDEIWLLPSRNDHSMHLTKNAAEGICKKISKRCGIEFTPHVIRHTTATTALHSGMKVEDISKVLGHAQISTTMIYAETDEKHVHAEHIRCVV